MFIRTRNNALINLNNINAIVPGEGAIVYVQCAGALTYTIEFDSIAERDSAVEQLAKDVSAHYHIYAVRYDE